MLRCVSWCVVTDMSRNSSAPVFIHSRASPRPAFSTRPLMSPESPRPAFLKVWSADHKWSSGSALVVLLDLTLVQKRQKK